MCFFDQYDTPKIVYRSTRPVLSFEELIDRKMMNKHLSYEEAVRDILETASKTNSDVNKEFGL